MLLVLLLLPVLLLGVLLLPLLAGLEFEELGGVEAAGVDDDVEALLELFAPTEARGVDLGGAVTAGGLGSLTTTTGPFVDASPAGAIAAAITVPNASIPITATAAALGTGSHELERAGATGRGAAGPIAPGTMLRPRSRIAAIMPATSGGSGPRRVPHSTQ